MSKTEIKKVKQLCRELKKTYDGGIINYEKYNTLRNIVGEIACYEYNNIGIENTTGNKALITVLRNAMCNEDFINFEDEQLLISGPASLTFHEHLQSKKKFIFSVNITEIKKTAFQIFLRIPQTLGI